MTHIEINCVDFNIAKWLKEKGFNDPCSHYYIDDFKHDGILYKWGFLHGEEHKNVFQFVSRKNEFYLCNAPEQWQVVEWLRVNHGIWIEVIETDLFQKYFFQIKRKDNTRLKNGDFNSPQESYLSAFNYIKNNNLI
jgi:hypothetical protein